MKKLVFLLLSGIFVWAGIFAQTEVAVTFRVDMSQEEVSSNGVHIAGNFQGWDPASTVMTLEGENIYAYTQNFAPGENIQYKFINGDAWGMDESVPGECAQDNNRYLVVPSSDTVLNAVCFGSCSQCGQNVNVTFRVNMQGLTISGNGVHVAGSMQGWDPASSEMTNVGDDIYEITFAIPSGTLTQYKFINGNDWPEAESVPADCGMDDGFGGYNRYFTLGEEDMVLDAYCFSTCDICNPPGIMVDVTFKVDMALEELSPDGVHIAGSFQGWDPSSTAMTEIDDFVYAYTVSLEAGSIVEYKFVNGMEWADAEIVPDACAQNGNRFLSVPETDIVLEEVCFGSCQDCSNLPGSVSVTFRVNLSEEEVSADGVHLAGSFQGWNPSTTEMNALGGNLFSITLDLDANQTYEYKYINGVEWADAESVPEDCGVDDGNGGFNRQLIAGGEDMILDTVCFSQCINCPVGITARNSMPQPVVFVSNDMLNIRFPHSPAAQWEVSLFDVTGKELAERKINIPEGSVVIFDVSSYDTGVYMYRLTPVNPLLGSIVSGKFIKE